MGESVVRRCRVSYPSLSRTSSEIYCFMVISHQFDFSMSPFPYKGYSRGRKLGTYSDWGLSSGLVINKHLSHLTSQCLSALPVWGRLGLGRVNFVPDRDGLKMGKMKTVHLQLPLPTTPTQLLTRDSLTTPLGTIDTPVNRDGDEFHS